MNYHPAVVCLCQPVSVSVDILFSSLIWNHLYQRPLTTEIESVHLWVQSEHLRQIWRNSLTAFLSRRVHKNGMDKPIPRESDAFATGIKKLMFEKHLILNNKIWQEKIIFWRAYYHYSLTWRDKHPSAVWWWRTPWSRGRQRSPWGSGHVAHLGWFQGVHRKHVGNPTGKNKNGYEESRLNSHPFKV